MKGVLQRRHWCIKISMHFLCTKISMTLVYHAAVLYSGRSNVGTASAAGKASMAWSNSLRKVAACSNTQRLALARRCLVARTRAC